MSEFKLIEENISGLRISDEPEFYDFKTFEKLVESAKEVQGISVFNGFTLPKYSSFVPFKYQKNAIDTMLIGFEGRGVFGDQVGLGKTIEALMSAHIMFRQKEIRNCLLICPTNLIDQWKNEMQGKFRVDNECVFDIEEASNIAELKNRINNADISNDKLKVFIVTKESFVNKNKIEEERQLHESIKNSKRRREELKREINELKNRKSILLDSEDPSEKKEIARSKAIALAQHKQLEEVYAPTKLIIDNIKEKEQELNELENEISQKEEESLWQCVIDLLIIDEVDTIINSAVKQKLEKEGKEPKTEDDDDKETSEEGITVLDALLKIKKKYCFLISATPLNSHLEDVYYLTQIVDETRFPNLDSFYNYVGARSFAELVEKEDNIKKLTGLINSMFTRNRMADEDVKQSYIPEKEYPIDHILDAVYVDSNRASQTIYREAKLDRREIQSRIDSITKSIKSEIALFAKRNGGISDEETLNNLYKNTYEYCLEEDVYKTLVMKGLYRYYIETKDVYVHKYIDWSRKEKEGKCFTNALGEKNIQYQLDRLINNEYFIQDIYFNEDLLIKNKEHDYKKKNKREQGDKEREYYAKIKALLNELKENPTKKDETIKKLQNFEEKNNVAEDMIIKKLYGKICDIAQNECILEKMDDLEQKTVIFEVKAVNRKILYDLIRVKYPDRKVFIDLGRDDIENIKKIIGENTEVLYNEKWKPGDDEDSYEEENEGMVKCAFNDVPIGMQQKAFKKWNKDEFSNPDIDYSDAVYLVDKTRREGANLNCASHLIVCQMLDDNSGFETFLDPLRFEQIIGRLNRVGQMNDITVDVYVDNKKEKALYDLYADEEGLALVSTGRAEVSFVVPIVTAVFENLAKKDPIFKDISNNTKYTRVFSDCYNEDLKDGARRLERLTEETRRICRLLSPRTLVNIEEA